MITVTKKATDSLISEYLMKGYIENYNSFVDWRNRMEHTQIPTISIDDVQAFADAISAKFNDKELTDLEQANKDAWAARNAILEKEVYPLIDIYFDEIKKDFE